MIDIGVVRNFWNARPCNIKHSDKTMGSTKYFKEVTERKFKVEPHIPSFANYAKYKEKCAVRCEEKSHKIKTLKIKRFIYE